MVAVQALGMDKSRDVKVRNIHTVKAKKCTKGDIDTLFTVTNLERTVEASAGVMGSMSLDAMNDDNPDNAFTRFEWIEFLVRLAAKRFSVVGHNSDDPVLTELESRPDLDALKPRVLEHISI